MWLHLALSLSTLLVAAFGGTVNGCAAQVDCPTCTVLPGCVWDSAFSVCEFATQLECDASPTCVPYPHMCPGSDCAIRGGCPACLGGLSCTWLPSGVCVSSYSTRALNPAACPSERTVLTPTPRQPGQPKVTSLVTPTVPSITCADDDSWKNDEGYGCVSYIPTAACLEGAPDGLASTLRTKCPLTCRTCSNGTPTTMGRCEDGQMCSGGYTCRWDYTRPWAAVKSTSSCFESSRLGVFARLSTPSEFDRLVSNVVDSSVENGLREVKIMVTLRAEAGGSGAGKASNQEQPKAWFVDANKIHLHHTVGELLLGIELRAFNELAYFSNARTILAGSIVAHDHYVHPVTKARGLYTFGFWPTDPVRYKHIKAAMVACEQAAPFLKGKLWYHPAGDTHELGLVEEAKLFAKGEVRVISSSDIYGSSDYMGLHHGSTFGRLVIVRGAAPTLSIKDIVVFRSAPNDLTHVAGVITDTPQTPLSHINLKARQNNMPNAYIRDASQLQQISELEGRIVKFQVSRDGWSMERATQREYEDFFDTLRPAKGDGPVPVFNLKVKNVRSLANIDTADATAFGAKAANVGALGRLLNSAEGHNDTVPRGFAVPFSFYHTFLHYTDRTQRRSLFQQAQAMLKMPRFKRQADEREMRLKSFRKTMENAPVPRVLLRKLQKMHDRFSSELGFKADRKLRCRSSTNNEDLENFNGAGLYESYTHKADEGHIGNTIKQVWAGLWTYRAFEEREFYRIDHFKTMMGVLVHPNFSDELCNGVAVTRNIFDPRSIWKSFYINVQVSEDLVTNPDAESTPDEFLTLYLPYGETQDEMRWETQFIRKSNQITEGKQGKSGSVLSEDMLDQLREELDKVHDYFKTVYEQDKNVAFAMELEFKVTSQVPQDHLPSPRLVIKQARPWVL